MTTLELTNWTGVDEDGPFLVMFGHIDQTADPDEMRFSKISPLGITMAVGTCVYASSTSFTIKDRTTGELIPGITDATFSFTIVSEVLSITAGAVVWKAALV